MIKMLKIILIVVFLIIGLFYSYCALADSTDGRTPRRCECVEYDCGCCAKLELKNIIDGKLCSNFSYLPDQYGIAFTVTYNDLAIINETISVKNPPPICVIHIDEVQMEICIRFYDLNVQDKHLSGCVEFEIAFAHIFHVKKIELGCFGKNIAPSINSRFRHFFDKFRYGPEDEHEPQVVYI